MILCEMYSIFLYLTLKIDEEEDWSSSSIFSSFDQHIETPSDFEDYNMTTIDNNDSLSIPRDKLQRIVNF